MRLLSYLPITMDILIH